MDLYLFNVIHDFSEKWPFLDWFVVFFADYLGYFIFLAFLILVFRERNRREKIYPVRNNIPSLRESKHLAGISNGIYFFSFVSLSLILARGIIAEAIKFFVSRPRPFSVLNFQPLIDSNGINASMPSGHAAFYFALATAIFLFNRKAGRWFFGAAFLIGLARIFTGIHWPMDILIGAVVGIGSVFLARYIFPAITNFFKNKV